MLPALGRLIARRPRWFLTGWLILIVAGFATAMGGLAGQTLFERLHSGAPQVPGESRTGQQWLTRTAPSGDTVFLLLDRVDPADPAVRAAVSGAAADLSRLPGVLLVADPYLPAPGVVGPVTATDTGPATSTGSSSGSGGAGPSAGATSPARPAQGALRDPALVATDGRGVLVRVTVRKDLPSGRTDAVNAAIEHRLRQVAGPLPGARGLVGSVPDLVTEITGQVRKDLGTGEVIALPLSLLVMILVFGGLLAAALPLGGAVASIAGALAALLGFSYLIDLDASVVNVVTLLGLGLCIDYGLLLTSRYREELRRLHAVRDEPPTREALVSALERTLGTAGRTVAFSGVTVAISLSGLMLFRAEILRAIGAAGVSVVVVALLAALTLVPALLATAGDRMIRGGLRRRMPLLNRLGDVSPEQGVFSRLATGVQRRAVLVVVGVLVVLGAAALPVSSIHLISSGVALLPTSAPGRQLFDGMASRFPRVSAPPISVVTRGTPVQAEQLAARIRTLPGVRSTDPVQEQGTAATGVVQVIGVRPAGDTESNQARDVVARIRTLHPAQATWVTGPTAAVVDFLADLRARAPLAIGVVVAATIVLLFLMTGSLLIPFKALLMNVVSLGASFGVLVWVFQDGHLHGLLRFTPAGGIETTIPALVLAFGFGLAMDYEVFLLSRIKEAYDQGLDNDAAVVQGLQRSGRIITSAALIVILVFAGFAAGQLLLIKENGVALAVAVAVDATLVRLLLVPATMSLLGEWNWWAPGPLRRWHARFGLREGEVPVHGGTE